MPRRKGPTPRKRGPDLKLLACTYCGTQQKITRARPPVAELRPRPMIPIWRYEEPEDWVAPCRECGCETATAVHAIMAA